MKKQFSNDVSRGMLAKFAFSWHVCALPMCFSTQPWITALCVGRGNQQGNIENLMKTFTDVTFYGEQTSYKTYMNP